VSTSNSAIVLRDSNISATQDRNLIDIGGRGKVTLMASNSLLASSAGYWVISIHDQVETDSVFANSTLIGDYVLYVEYWTAGGSVSLRQCSIGGLIQFRSLAAVSNPGRNLHFL
jgi:hypothetical protein